MSKGAGWGVGARVKKGRASRVDKSDWAEVVKATSIMAFEDHSAGASFEPTPTVFILLGIVSVAWAFLFLGRATFNLARSLDLISELSNNS